LQSIDGAKELFERRATFLKEKIEMLQPQVMNKVKQKRMVEEVSAHTSSSSDSLPLLHTF
jgi:hypothetical protein